MAKEFSKELRLQIGRKLLELGKDLHINDRAAISALRDHKQIKAFTHDVRTLYLNGGANWTAGTTGDSIEFVYNGSEWIETNRSDNT